MNRLQKSKDQVLNIIKNENKYNFCSFLCALRAAICISRRAVCDDLDIQYLKMFDLECGNFRYPPHPHILDKVSDYYGVERELMKEKADKFIKKLTEV